MKTTDKEFIIKIIQEKLDISYESAKCIFEMESRSGNINDYLSTLEISFDNSGFSNEPL